jgi:hypothetical protein
VSAVAELTKTIGGLQARVTKFDGWRLERRYIERAPGYFGKWLRRVRVIWPGELDDKFEDQLETQVSREELEDILRLDAIVRGRARQLPDQPEIYLAVEASVVIDISDVTRARRRAALLRRLGLRTIPVVAGEHIEVNAEEEAEESHVAVLRNGHGEGWEGALAAS